jgi:hypothetical protein
LNNDLVALSGVVGSADSAPTKQSYEVFDMLSKSVDEQLAKWKTIVSTDVAAYNALVKQQEVPHSCWRNRKRENNAAIF